MIGWILIALFGWAGWSRAEWRRAAGAIVLLSLAAATVEGVLIARYQAGLFDIPPPYERTIALRFLGGLLVCTAAYWAGRGLRRWKAGS